MTRTRTVEPHITSTDKPDHYRVYITSEGKLLMNVVVKGLETARFMRDKALEGAPKQTKINKTCTLIMQALQQYGPMTRTELCERLSICETAVCRQIRRLLELNMVQQVAPSVDALLANPRTKAAFSLVGEDVASGEKQDCWAARMIATEKWLSENPNSSANAIAAGLGFSRATADVVLKKLRVASKCYVSGQGPERINGGTPAYLYSAGSLPDQIKRKNSATARPPEVQRPNVTANDLRRYAGNPFAIAAFPML